MGKVKSANECKRVAGCSPVAGDDYNVERTGFDNMSNGVSVVCTGGHRKPTATPERAEE
jgi:hypothetical protein